MGSDYSNVISELFSKRSKFIILGLTGRTGSGCTTASRVLSDAELVLPDVDDLNYNNQPFYSGLDSERYSIATQYLRKNFKNFITIKISDLISAYILQTPKDELIKFISKVGNIDNDRVKSVLDKGIFSKTPILKYKLFVEISEKMITHRPQKECLNCKQLCKLIPYMAAVQKFTVEFKKELNELSDQLYLRFYQDSGNSIRRCGQIKSNFKDEVFIPSSIHHLPETINRVILNLCRKNERDNEETFIVLDAIRNPYEAKYFRDLYSAFYLISINAPDKDRNNYLQKIHQYRASEVDALERRESGVSRITDEDFYTQNVKKCIEMSDIHIFNPRNEVGNNNILKAQLAWYLSLIIHPGLISPTAMERSMQIAMSMKVNSGCISRQVGAVVTDRDNSVKSVGWNDVAKGQIPCNLRSLNDLNSTFNEIKYSYYERNEESFRKLANEHLIQLKNVGNETGRSLAYCFKDLKNELDDKGNQVHTRSLHAEENAFLQLVKYGGVGIEGGKLYTTASPCELCAKKAYQLGIQEIIYIDPYPGLSTEHIFFSGTRKPNLIQFRGAVGRGYHSLYESQIAYKDELNYLKTMSEI